MGFTILGDKRDGDGFIYIDSGLTLFDCNDCWFFIITDGILDIIPLIWGLFLGEPNLDLDGLY